MEALKKRPMQPVAACFPKAVTLPTPTTGPQTLGVFSVL